MTHLSSFISNQALEQLILHAREEDLGPSAADITSQAMLPESMQGQASFVARESGCLAGVALLQAVAQCYDTNLTVTLQCDDGSTIQAGQTLADIQGPLRSILMAERIALNLMSHLSGIASLTASYVVQVAGTKAQIADTRKTLPGLRALQKYAVACGGGVTHRIGLYDAMLIKDNHLAHLAADQWTDAVANAIHQARAQTPDMKFAMVEVDTLEQCQAMLKTGADILLLDNMTTSTLTQAVAMRDELAPQVLLEASGGVTLKTVKAIAQTGVDRISVGQLTHSVPALDIGLDIL